MDKKTHWKESTNYSPEENIKKIKEAGELRKEINKLLKAKDTDKELLTDKINRYTLLIQLIDWEKKKGKFKKSSLLTDQTLKYNKGGQLSIFDSLQEPTRKDIEKRSIDKESIIEGIDLSGTEYKILDCLCKLLHDKSKNVKAPKEKDYYTGSDSAVENYPGLTGSAISPFIMTTKYELAKEYSGNQKNPSGNVINQVDKIIKDLSKKEFLIRYSEREEKKNGDKVVKSIELYQAILTLPEYTEITYSKDGEEKYRHGDTLIMLHPIFRRHIEKTFLLMPEDIIMRMEIANGSAKISEATYKLRDHLLRALSGGNCTTEILLENLYLLVAEKYMNESRKKLVKDKLDKAIETCKNLGIIKDYRVEPAKTSGEPKAIFTLNKDWI